MLGGPAREISADRAYYSEDNETYAGEQDKDIHYTGFPGKKGRYDYERTDAGVVATERESGEQQQAEEYKLKYRGKCRGQLWAVCRAAWINMRRIASYQAKQVEASA